MKKSKWAVVWLCVAFSLGVFAIAGLIFLPLAISDDVSPANDEQSNIPYFSVPQNSGILYLSPDGSGALIFLNFEQQTAAVNLFLDDAENKALTVGYEINYTLLGNNEFLCELCDRLGGIDLYENGKEYRFTGAGLAEKLASADSILDLSEISEGFFKKISKIGLSNEDFQFIIENTKTNLNFPVCYSWREALKDTVSRYIFENV